MTISEILNYLDEKGVYGCAWEDGPAICVSIGGDWKHEHLRMDCLMRQIGYDLYNEEVTETDGSDCYESTHTYLPHDIYSRVDEFRKLFEV